MDSLTLESSASFFGISPEKFLSEIGILKAESNKRSPGVAGPTAMRGFIDDSYDINSSKGIRENYQPIPFSTLREIERKTPIVSAIVNTRCRQMRPFSRPSLDDDKPGFKITIRDRNREPNSEEKKEMARLTKWFYNTGRTDFKEALDREDLLHDSMVKSARDLLTIDQLAIEIRRDLSGNAVDFWVLDGATIRRVVHSGYKGSKSDFDPRTYIHNDSAIYKKLIEEKISLIPNPEDIAYVQVVEGRPRAAYRRQDLILDSMNKRTDLRFHGQNYSCLEQAMSAVTAFLNGLNFNSEAFSSGTLPKIALAFKDGNFSEEQLIALQEEFIANFRGAAGAWRIPLINAEVTAIDLNKSPRDMEYMKYLEFTGALICAIYGIDSAELGLRFQQAQNVMSENMGARTSYSKDRGLNDLLGALQNIYNKVLKLSDKSDQYIFAFTGIEPEDRETASKLRTEALKSYKTVDEIRAEEDMKPLPDGKGEIILDPSWIQNKQNAEMSQMGGEEEGGFDENPDIDEVIDESFDDMFKAINPNKIRTLLI